MKARTGCNEERSEVQACVCKIIVSQAVDLEPSKPNN